MIHSTLPNQADVVIVGAGAAGLYAALCIPPQYSVCLLTKEKLKVGASDWAQGGIAAAIAPTDSVIAHLEDTLKAGAGLCDRTAVEFLVNHAPAAIEQLVQFGVAFDRHGDQLALTTEAAHSHPRVLHAADTTGRAIVSILTERVLERPNIQVFAHALAVKLWLNETTNHCQGLCVWHQVHSHWLQAQAVILATGGGGQVFAQTTNPKVSTGDGVALAWHAGAELRDLEFFQFHPTALMKPGAPCFLISEAVRGEGAHLIDAQGDRFAFNYHLQGELAPRDVVSRAIFQHLNRPDRPDSGDCVYLDLAPIPASRVQYRFPNIIRVCQRWGIDLFAQPIPVAPAAHYWMGGITTNTENCTSIPGLYAIGEVTNTGVHGANRLASNSLLECVVFAAQFAHLELPPLEAVSRPTDLAPEPLAIATPEITWLDYQRQIQQIMWQAAGICRDATGLTQALNQLENLIEVINAEPFVAMIPMLEPEQTLQLTQTDQDNRVRASLETYNLLAISQLILSSALFRTESRGGHYRSDYPQTDVEWAKHTIVQGQKQWRSP
ncbi:MAG: L-aspartate oxidase [Spirulina sp. SIO3F2]|nr:L-aspartate oxidase [Spirulina sp. SIO3F2]